MKLSATVHRLVLLLAAGGAAALMLWTALGSWQLPAVGPKQADYYNLLVAGFRKGSLALDIEVPEALKKMADPWDASVRPPGLAPHDVSYFGGHYYLYFGVVPAVLLFWPFRALTGHDLPFVWSAIVFGVGACLGSAWLWLRVVRDQFPRAGLVTKLAGVAALGLVGGQLALERRVSIWEVPIEGGHFFMMGFVIAAYRALRSPRPWPWLGAAGAALGLAVGCRPTLVAAGPALALLTIVIGSQAAAGGAGFARRLGGAILAAGIPLAAVLAGLFAYNYARFGNPFEFGTIYQLSGGYDYRAKHFSFSFLPFNAFVYFWSEPEWGRYFPFLHPIATTPHPAGYYGIEYVYGALVICPVLWWSLFGPLGWGARRERPVLAGFLGFLALVAAGTTLLLLCFNVAAARYVADFLPWWVWLGMIGWACLEDRLAGRQGRAALLRVGLRGLFAACVAMSCVLALCASAEVHGVLRFLNPVGYAQLARVFDTPVAWWERLTGFRGGAMEMTVIFPERNSSSVEPLITTGVEYQKDYVFVYYTDPGRIQLGFDTLEGRSPVTSAVLAVVPGRPYRLHVECGPLFPPAGFPTYDGWNATEVRSFTNWTRIDLDGRTVLSRPSASDEASPGSIRIGRDVAAGLYGARFSGTIRDVVRVGLRRHESGGAGAGDVWLRLVFPPDGPSGVEPLVVAGKAGQAQLVGMRMVDAGHFVLTQEIWGAGLWESGVLAVPPGRSGTVRVRLGPILGVDEGSPMGLLSHSLVVWLDDIPVWWRRDLAEVPSLGRHPPVDVGENVIGSSAMTSAFQGRLEAWGRDPSAPAWRAGPFEAAVLELSGRDVGTEPLVTSGRPDESDLLEVRWLPGDRACLVYTHGGDAPMTSDSFGWDGKTLHRLKVGTPAMATLDAGGAAAVGRGTLRVELDGHTAWETAVPFYEARSDSVAIGRKGVAARATRPALVCTFVDIRQEGGKGR